MKIASNEERRKEYYDQIKRRLCEYRYRSALLNFGALASAFLFIFSFIPIVPIFIINILGLVMYSWGAPLWFLCIGVFLASFWICQRFSRKIEEKRGVTLEERMYISAYEALCYFKEYSDPKHPIKSGRFKAERRIQSILTLLGQITFPNLAIVTEESVQYGQLHINLRTRLLPLLRRNNGNTHTLLTTLVDYFSKPELSSLVDLNKTIGFLPEIKERNIYLYLRSAFLKRSNLRHIGIALGSSLVALLIYHLDLNYFGASLPDAFALGIGSLLALIAMYITYLVGTIRKEQRT